MLNLLHDHSGIIDVNMLLYFVSLSKKSEDNEFRIKNVKTNAC